MAALVRIALRLPYTFIVLALLILIAGGLAAIRTPVDIFPEIRIPVIATVWQYKGLPPDDMAGRMVTPFQRALTTTVNDIEHIEANSYSGIGVVKIFFHPKVNISVANAQVTAIAQTMLRQLPPGSTAPLILNYSASTVPILQLALAGEGLNEQNLADLGMNQVRIRLVTVPGAAIPYPYGGKQRQIQIDLDTAALHAKGLSAQDVASAFDAQNLINPVGTQKIGATEYTMQLNSAPSDLAALGDLPIKAVNGGMVYVKDVARVRDGSPPQQNVVHVNGARSVLLSVLKSGAISTPEIIQGIKDKVQEIKPGLPDALTISYLGDQSLFVRGAVNNVIHEGVLAAALTSLMILLFLGSIRSTIIIATSIPLAVLASIATLSALGETLNIMTLGGLALAVGILVDEATVTIENINYHLEQGKDVETAILDGADQIATPAFVSMLCICIVFVPMFFLEGVARFLFVPMAEAVVFAMVASFILSRTLVPTMAKFLLKPHDPNAHDTPTRNPFMRFQRKFEHGFEALRLSYRGLLDRALSQRALFLLFSFGFIGLSFYLVPYLGRNFFPAVDSGQILIHARLEVGTRVEESSRKFAEIQDVIRAIIPAEELDAIVDNIGMPISGINVSYNNTGMIGSQDGDIQIALKEGHRPTAEYVSLLRDELPQRFPGTTFSFLPADIVSQILNFGAPTPIDLQIRGANLTENFNYANKLLRKIRMVPGVADARIQQSRDNPGFKIDVDRSRAKYVGVTARDVTSSLGTSLSGSGQVSPVFWLNPRNGVSYPIVMQTPQYSLDSLASLQNLPITAADATAPQVLGSVINLGRKTSNAVVSQYDIQSMVQILTTTEGRDLGAVAADIQKIVDEAKADLPKGATAVLLGQVRTMNSAYSGMLFGLLGAIVLIYLLIVVNFQSWTDPLVIIMALPAALAGIIWMLFTTGTTLSVPALTGAIMCMGVATANAVLVVSFARERLAEHGDPIVAALESGYVRIRPVLMTALAMIIGMAPMALGLGEGGEQNAPLGRAVIGGLVFATAATLFVVPLVFSLMHRRKATAAPTDFIPGEFNAA
ncbi:acriflavin resistance protein [Hyphomicrobium denitrificans ATCC 51888]|uniref:Acriflavin resistance protein n=1 Tax=Hyphomicrobium denitrificans (strain ATCC 51888 / DSM 1869 / NCIMB 11706 / TK 0415) TaxID=582899 RepID=D8JXQ2_HYPDA|nr:efflux RND transporter permease subunit [Hyphomicrobium denitrificans]ADJ25233.1 acriflavin resistance protein [Hyphomicrobium denitrificans ATCC 51888]